jgi:hypothetical protein
MFDHLNKDEMELKDVTSIGSRQHSLGESSLEGSRSFTPQSDNRSYRDRLRDRFQAVRVSRCFVLSYHSFFTNMKVRNYFVVFYAGTCWGFSH